MSSSQKRANDRYRDRLAERGMVRFEVIGRETDRELIRMLARELAEDGSDAGKLRHEIETRLSGDGPTRGGILAALRRSPLVGAGLDPKRERTGGRKVVL